MAYDKKTAQALRDYSYTEIKPGDYESGRQLPRVSESLFRSQMLPMIAKSKSLEDIQPWLDIATSAFISVEVWTDDKSKKLWTVPPVRFHKEEIRDVNLFELIAAAARQDKSPMAIGRPGDRLLMQHLGGKMGVGKPPAEFLKAWQDTFAFFDGTYKKEEVGDAPGQLQENEVNEWD